MNNKEQKTRKEIAHEVFYDLPPRKERQVMSPEELAVLLSECEKDSPKYALISHELNLRIVKEQNKPVYLGAALAIVGVFLAWILYQWQPFKEPDAIDIITKHLQSHSEGCATTIEKKDKLQPQDEDFLVQPRGQIKPPVAITRVPEIMKRQTNENEAYGEQGKE